MKLDFISLKRLLFTIPGGAGMTEKELKKLNRYQLLELLLVQTERADSLQQKAEQLQAKLDERELRFAQLGSIAEASVCVSGVFEAAQKAADLYLEAAKKQADELLEKARREAAEYESRLASAQQSDQTKAAKKQNVRKKQKKSKK